MRTNIYTRYSGLVILFLCVALFLCAKQAEKPKVLVFTKTAGFHHSSIPLGINAVMKLGIENNFDVDTTTNAAWFTDDVLKKYAAVIFLNTTGDVLNNYQETEFERYIQSGGGYVGIHAASDTEYGWGWYGRMVGGYFNGHPIPQEAVLNIEDNNHPSTRHLPAQWKRTDEWYNYKKLNPDVKVLISIDEKSYKGGTNGDKHPIAWYHDYDGGRAFFTGLGHTDESYADPLYLKHILGGIQYAMGDNNALDYTKAKSPKVPEDNRFVRKMLTQGGFYEPTEIAVLPNLDVLITQRRGELMKYDNATKTLKQVGFLDVYFKALSGSANSEEGLLGITADPNFASNHFIYMYYSPTGTASVDRLSRFVFENDTLDYKSEKVILEVGTQREICCHTGGSIAFGKDNVLFVSAGDNSTPFDEPGQKYPTRSFGPMDDRPGHEQYDARRSAGNTNDLRGKIIRIKINADGSYDIPEGNLFPKGTPKTRPEIYVMGNRNPYRISVDKKSGYLYWGEVGPDASVDSIGTRGSRGYDEVNQARKAGFFGWPLFVGNNYSYNIHNYDTNENGPPQNPNHPLNTSRNNTGLTELPPAQPAYIWYPYAVSPEFPELGTGGRTAMAGPVYHVNDFTEANRYPGYYNDKFFFYDFIRGWIKVATQLPNGDLDKIESFMPNERYSALMDMEVGPDGRIYVLDYGSGWYNKNPDAALYRVDYLPGNRPPAVTGLKLNKTSGNLPLTITAGIKATDPENDVLSYVWHIGNVTRTTTVPTLTYVITQPGDHDVSVEVFDSKKASTTSKKVVVTAGNAEPQVSINIKGNRSFYFAGKPVSYKVNVVDQGAAVNPTNLYVSTRFIKGSDLAGANWGHQVMSETMQGKNLMLSLDCKACHKETEKSIGPAFKAVADKYLMSPDAGSYLPNKIIKGGAGVWGEVAMPAHPALKEAEARQIVTWIRSLAFEKPKSLAPAGIVTPKASDIKEQNTVYSIDANYTDAGAYGIRPLSGSYSAMLRSNVVEAGEFKNVKGFAIENIKDGKQAKLPVAAGSLKIGTFDLTGISSLELTSYGTTADAITYAVELHTGSPAGLKIGSGTLNFTTDKQPLITKITLVAKPATAKPVVAKLQDIYLVVKQTTANANPPVLKAVRFVPL
ncbi:MAG: ThuA domain-containing protein [Mucilaginibacter sp.]